MKPDEIQERQYDFPYHYLPRMQEGRLVLHEYWSWGIRYLGGIDIVMKLLEEVEFSSVLDFGCGDGRLTAEIAYRWPSCECVGVDISERAIKLAKAMAQHGDFRHVEKGFSSDEDFDVVIAMEVLEHIAPADTAAVVEGMSESISPGGTAIVTVPHVNKPVSGKHHRHFDRRSLSRILEPEFRIERMLAFDQRSRVFRMLWKLLGGSGESYLIAIPWINYWIYKIYKRWLWMSSFDHCLRMAAVCKKL